MRLLLAYGNPLRGDDGAAWEVAQFLGRCTDVEVACIHQLTEDLAMRVAQADGVLFIHTAARGHAGHVEVGEVHEAADPARGPLMTPPRLLSLVRELTGKEPPA